MARKPPASALDALDDDNDQPEAEQAAPPPVLAEAPTLPPVPENFAFTLQDQLEDAVLAAMDGVASAEQHALLAAHGLGRNGYNGTPEYQREAFRLNKLRTAAERAMSPEQITEAKAAFEQRSKEVNARCAQLREELAEAERRITTELRSLESGLNAEQRRLSEAEQAVKLIRENAPAAVMAVRNQMLRNDWEPVRVAAQDLRTRVHSYRVLVANDNPELIELWSRDPSHPAHRLGLHRITGEPNAHGSLHELQERKRLHLQANLPALRKTIREELPDLERRLAEAEAAEAAVKARCDAPVNHHLRKWLNRKPSPAADTPAG